MPGIGEKRAVKLSSEGLTVNGEAFKPVASAKAAAPKEKVTNASTTPAPKQ